MKAASTMMGSRGVEPADWTANAREEVAQPRRQVFQRGATVSMGCAAINRNERPFAWSAARL